MPLYSRRRRQREIADQEAQGTSFWTDSFDESFRYKIKNYIDSYASFPENVCAHARRVMLLELGRPFLAHRTYGAYEDVMTCLITGTDDTVPDAIEALRDALVHSTDEYFSPFNIRAYDNFVKQALLEHRIAFDLVNGEMREKKSQELHTAVVEPTLTLLSGRPEYAAVNTAYTAALEELTTGNPADALTDAGTALQEMLKLLDCPGRTLGEQIRQAKVAGLLGNQDSPLLEGIEGTMKWGASERNQRSDAHKVGVSDGLCKWWSPEMKEIDCDHDQGEGPVGDASPPVAA